MKSNLGYGIIGINILQRFYLKRKLDFNAKVMGYRHERV